ncbi:MAG TPA: carbon monoxide dehydrogenase subunit G [Lunatimonas sp.]|nr:carbon monoxide dehydrogenase subunit G [Lunatimonas sp.]
MHLTGNQIVNADPSSLWKILMDPVSLAKVVPNVSSLEKLSDDCFSAKLSLKIGPVNGNFSGNLYLDDINLEKSFALRTLQQSKIGNANADVQINLVPLDDNQTEVIFDGNIKLSGMLAGIGQRLVGGIANKLTQQFFENLQNELTVTSN